jgi:2-hydroxychromene-2-carboxylate isomerase
MKKLEFFFDFASPNAYFAYKALPDLLERTKAELEVVPMLLGGLFKLTNNQPPFITFKDVKGKSEYEKLEIARFIKKHKLKDFAFNSHFPLNTVMLMRGLVAAQQMNVQSEYIDAILAATWEQSKKVDDPEVFAGVLKDAGINADALLELIQSDSVKDTLKQNTQMAADRGAFGTPTFFVGDEMFFGKERLGQVEEELMG